MFSKYGYKSLFEYAVKRFGYSEDEAYRRISAMRLMKEIPQVEEKIESGALSLSNIAQAQTLFRHESRGHVVRSCQEKVLLLEKLENCSKIEASKIIEVEKRGLELGDMLNIVQKESGYDQSVEYRFRANQELQRKLKRLFALNNFSEFDLAELLNKVCDIALEKTDPIEKAKRAIGKAKRAEKLEERVYSNTEVSAEGRKLSVPDQKSRVKRTYYPQSVRHQVFLRSEGKCERCGGQRRLEIDHITPFAKSGSDELKNLRVLCRSCNQRSAIEIFGIKKMSAYLRAPASEYLN